MTVTGFIREASVEYGERTVLKTIHADIPRGAKIAIIGRNGTGKSTLLNRIAEGGQGIRWNGKAPVIAYVEQETEMPVQRNLSGKAVWQKEWKIPGQESGLSGGEKMKLRLANALDKEADLLLLDEPTNHLDTTNVRILTDELNRFSGTLLFVSHDRHFIDDVATHVWEIENGTLTVYEGNYTVSRQEKERRFLSQLRKYEKQQAKVANVEQQINELQAWSGKAHAQSTKQEGFKEYYRVKAKRMDTQIRSKRKRLEAELASEKVERPVEEAEVSFTIQGGAKKGKRIIEVKRVTKHAGERPLFENASFAILHGERVALVGENGCGKTTLFGLLRGEPGYSGEVWVTAGMKIGYLSQTVYDLPEEKTPAELFSPVNFDQAGRIRTLMDNLGFDADHYMQPVRHMSMGERVKLKLMNFILSECDVLFLDEPTNHLDLPSREQLEKTLSQFPGTLLLATHDRYFMERLATKLLVFQEGTVTKYEGGYTDWLKKAEKSERYDLLQLETEQQAVLGKLSSVKLGSPEYRELDRRFKELAAAIREAKRQRV